MAAPSAAVRATVGASAAGIAVGWNVANVGAVADTLSDAYGVGLGVIGLLTTVLFVTHLLGQLPAGRLVDRIGARPVVLGALAVLAGANAIALVAPELWLGLLARTLAGIGTSFAFIAASDYVRAASGSPFAQGVYGGVNLGASGVALAIVPLFDGLLAWRSPFATAAVVAIAAAPIVAFGPRERSHPVLRTGEVHDSPSVVLDRRLYRLATVHAASFGLNVVVGNWVVTLLEEAGYASAVAAGIGALTLLGGVASRPLGGWIARRERARARAAVGASLALGAGATAMLAVAGPIPVAALSALAVGFAAGIPFAPAFTGAAAQRPDSPGRAVAFVNGSAGLTILVGTPLLGLTFSLPGDGRIGFAAVALLWAAALLVLPSRRELGVEEPG